MDHEIKVNFEHPANSGILKCLSSPERLKRSVSVARDYPSCSPESVYDPYMKLGTHPDLLEYFWDKVAIKLPMKCRWIVYGTPVLVNPVSGVIFGFAQGTSTYAFRLPPKEFQEAINAGASRVHTYPAIPSLNKAVSIFDLKDIGKEWIFLSWLKMETDLCLAAYLFANEERALI